MNKRNPKKRSFKQERTTNPISSNEDFLRLNRILSNAGYCSRREADKLIEQGLVTVNGKVVTELGVKVGPDDEVCYAGEKVRREQFRYILLNKPKDFVTTTDNPSNKKTVIELVKSACREAVQPIGRLSRTTTGLIVLTNDGEMVNRLANSRNGIPKTYKVELDKNFSDEGIELLEEGVVAEDTILRCDEAFFPDKNSRKVVMITVRSNKPDAVKLMLEGIGFKALRLDRVAFAGLTKGELTRGKWRFLTDKEIGFLKMIK